PDALPIYHEGVDPLVGDDEVRAAAEHPERHPSSPGPLVRREHRRLVAGLHEEPRGSADTHRAVVGERDVLERCHTLSIARLMPRTSKCRRPLTRSRGSNTIPAAGWAAMAFSRKSASGAVL